MKNTSGGWIFKMKYKLKDGKTAESKNWAIGYWVNGKQIREVVSPDKRFAESVLQKRLTEIRENKYFDIKKIKNISFDELVKEVLESKKGTKSYLFYSERIKQLSLYFGGMLLTHITPYIIDQYKTHLSGKVSPATINRNLAVLKLCLNLAIKWGKMDKNPFVDVKFVKEEKKKIKFLHIADIDKLLNNCSGTLKDFVLTALHTGARKNEIIGLKWGNVDFKTNLIILEKTKGNEVRQIPMTITLKNALLARKKDGGGEYVFYPKDSDKYSKNGIRTAFNNALKRAGLPHMRIHELRHTFGAQAVMAGIDLTTLQQLMGHKDIKTTMIYSHITAEHKRLAIARYEDVLSGNIVNMFGKEDSGCSESVHNGKVQSETK